MIWVVRYTNRECVKSVSVPKAAELLIEQEEKIIPIVGIRTRYNLPRQRKLSFRQVQIRDP